MTAPSARKRWQGSEARRIETLIDVDSITRMRKEREKSSTEKGDRGKRIGGRRKCSNKHLLGIYLECGSFEDGKKKLEVILTECLADDHVLSQGRHCRRLKSLVVECARILQSAGKRKKERERERKREREREREGKREREREKDCARESESARKSAREFKRKSAKKYERAKETVYFLTNVST